MNDDVTIGGRMNGDILAPQTCTVRGCEYLIMKGVEERSNLLNLPTPDKF